MEALFSQISDMSVSASWLIIAVVFIRFLLQKAPKGFRYVLWALVAIRLVCPISIESDFSLIPSKETIESVGEAVKPIIPMNPSVSEGNGTVTNDNVQNNTVQNNSVQNQRPQNNATQENVVLYKNTSKNYVSQYESVPQEEDSLIKSIIMSK